MMTHYIRDLALQKLISWKDQNPDEYWEAIGEDCQGNSSESYWLIKNTLQSLENVSPVLGTISRSEMLGLLYSI